MNFVNLSWHLNPKSWKNHTSQQGATKADERLEASKTEFCSFVVHRGTSVLFYLPCFTVTKKIANQDQQTKYLRNKYT